MKTKVLIIGLLVVSLLAAFTLRAQDSTKTLLADETTISYSKTVAKIECDNDAVFISLFKTHQQLFKRYTCTWKTDRHGNYRHYAIYLNKDDAAIIAKWAKTNL